MSNDFFTTSNRIKKTPFTSRNEQAGVKKHSVYNNTLIPTIFKSLNSDYLHLIKYVQLWDVCCQKVIEIKGKKALEDKSVDFRIFGKPFLKSYRRMGIVLAETLDKAKIAAKKVIVRSQP